ncbi:DUF47 family protein [Nakamurella antarctica]|uniref:DUF47 family protein n=1 Tax=Nakamurella antarctica TaxID=1902245 RepID=A0A3G8ZQK6_9ACTN|nr:DUF47 family protein [Nakamurella antarctica]AZI59087.1 DUF47 family protein [Nakamurella antarctica]
MSKFKPKDKSFYALFSAAAENIAAGAQTLSGLTGKKADLASGAARLAELEQAGDLITLDLLRILGASFVTPFDRSDIHHLTSALEDVIDHMESAGALIHLLDIGQLPSEASILIDILVQCAGHTTETMPKLRKLKGLDSYWTDIKKAEKDANVVHRQLLVRITSGEFDPLHAMKIRAVGSDLLAAVDCFENVADIVRAVLIKES